ncbi:uncharacterized protein TNCV_2630191 [Trichonephila clavipes]|uniref:Uncharacterized protein n=1 Tax=Trichonephila clavipes TaxID=2585209 RepID=A0A8X6V9U0_TRICX|nr:uncharacterized protein TNCV_2630191 [Trichonephila clavipes]
MGFGSVEYSQWPNKRTSRASQFSVAKSLRMSEPLAFKTAQRIRNAWAIFAIKARNTTSSWRVSTHHGVQQERQRAGQLAKTRTSPTAMSPTRLITSRLTEAGSLLPPVYSEAWAKATQGLLATDHVISSHGQVTWTTPELAPPLITTTPHQWEDVSALDRFNVHRCLTRRVFSGTGSNS